MKAYTNKTDKVDDKKCLFGEIKANDKPRKTAARRVLKPLNFFDPIEFAYDVYGETLAHMSEAEIAEISNYDNEAELRSYLQGFYERT